MERDAWTVAMGEIKKQALLGQVIRPTINAIFWVSNRVLWRDLLSDLNGRTGIKKQEKICLSPYGEGGTVTGNSEFNTCKKHQRRAGTKVIR
ncbi:MAG: hypothetical protein LBE98_00030 [Puniceicoccales bacterium]|nr:hypothetical protein [Puniceicoccales bacterium]